MECFVDKVTPLPVNPCKGENVPVLVWQITAHVEKALDRYEGWSHLHRKERIKVKVDKKTKRHIQIEETDTRKRSGRVDDEEMLDRLIYYGVTQLKRTEDEIWNIANAFGDLLDQWEIHKQFIGLTKPKNELSIDDVIPYGIWISCCWIRGFILSNISI